MFSDICNHVCNLITNYVQLEYLLLRKKDDSLFQNGTIHFVVMDELHAEGLQGVLGEQSRRRFGENQRTGKG